VPRHFQARCDQCVTSVVDCVRRACRVVARRSLPVSSASADVVDQFHASPCEERKCGDGVDNACVASPAHVAHTRNDNAAFAAPVAAASTAYDVINCCSDDDTVTSSVAADCVTESSALTYAFRFLLLIGRAWSKIRCLEQYKLS